MRRIKFRGKDVKTGEWVYGGYFKHEGITLSPIGEKRSDKNNYTHLIITSGFSDWNLPKPIQCYEVKEETVGQYVDKCCGEELYEGDIFRDDTYEDILYILEFCEDTKSYYLSGASEDGKRLNKDYVGRKRFLEVSCDKIGNRYDNPELLKEY